MIGHISINISFIIYCIYFLPQIIHNQLKHQAGHISHGTHLLMVIANVLDLIYGFGFDLQWQYRVVTMLTLGCLLFQQWQIYRDSERTKNEKRKKAKSYNFHIICLLVIAVGIALVSLHNLNDTMLENIGFISMFCYAVYWLPQIIKNIKEKNATAFSLIFLVLNVLALVCDEISALNFGWPLPSIISPIIILSLLFIMVGQYYYYQRLRMIIN
ncbi:PQ-loop repeat-containing protein [Cysteiniphilum halobium]|uniref:PQ-loop repeat-containing protein n=1 Tax=Cysteiniphilum halobium TaxID=2219059 RepID=UPI000E653315|nr:PQ-loop repeat-containing protein [Cysteiniphilum halobium]